MKDLVSIVIPVYNKEKYISKCIESVIAQTYEDLEILVIDDGSIDNSYHIIKNFAKKDKRIKSIQQVNSGVGAARNKGILNAKGRYILFLDADDALAKDYVETLMRYQKYDLVVSGIKLISINTKRNEHQIVPESSIKRLPYDIEKTLTHANYPIFSIVCTKLFNLSIIKENNLAFLPIQYGEDSIFMLAYLSKITSVKTIPYVGYINYIIPDTLSHGRRKDAWQQAKLIPEKAKEFFDLSNESSIWQFLMLRSIKLSFMNSTDKYTEFKKTFQLIKGDDVIRLLNISRNNRKIDNLIVLMVKYQLVFLLYKLFKLKN